MTHDDLTLAVDRHATSKLDDEDLLRIRTLGFRGEALPSIGAVAKLGITTRHATEPHCLVAVGRRRREIAIMPAALRPGHPRRGQRSLLCDPARLNFSDRPHRSRSDP